MTRVGRCCRSLFPSFCGSPKFRAKENRGTSTSFLRPKLNDNSNDTPFPHVRISYWGQSKLRDLLKHPNYPSSWAYVLKSFRDGRRPHEIPPSRPQLCPQTSTPPKPRNLSLPTRIDRYNMAESKGGTAVSGEAHHVGQEEYGG